MSNYKRDILVIEGNSRFLFKVLNHLLLKIHGKEILCFSLLRLAYCNGTSF